MGAFTRRRRMFQLIRRPCKLTRKHPSSSNTMRLLYVHTPGENLVEKPHFGIVLWKRSGKERDLLFLSMFGVKILVHWAPQTRSLHSPVPTNKIEVIQYANESGTFLDFFGLLHCSICAHSCVRFYVKFGRCSSPPPNLFDPFKSAPPRPMVRTRKRPSQNLNPLEYRTSEAWVIHPEVPHWSQKHWLFQMYGQYTKDLRSFARIQAATAGVRFQTRRQSLHAAKVAEKTSLGRLKGTRHQPKHELALEIANSKVVATRTYF